MTLYDNWYLNHSIWYLRSDICYAIFDICKMILDIYLQSLILDIWYSILNIWLSISDTWQIILNIHELISDNWYVILDISYTIWYLIVMSRHGNNSSPTWNLEYRGNSYCEVRDTVFVLDYNIIVKELQGLSQDSFSCLID